MSERSGHLLLIDASGIAYRALNSGPKFERPSDGMPIGAVLQYIKIVWKLLGAARADQPTHAVAVFDTPVLTFRHILYPAYKAHRGPRMQRMRPEFEMMKQATDVLGMTSIAIDGFEADDIIATYARLAVTAGFRVTIVSVDKDMLQLVEDGKVEIVDPRRERRVREADVFQRFGVRPGQVPDVQAICGDAADGIPGVKGLGVREAGELVSIHGSLASVLDWSTTAYNLAANKIRRATNDIKVYYELTRLNRRVPVEPRWETFMALRAPRLADVEAFLGELECPFKLNALFKINFEGARDFVAGGDPFEWWREEIEFPGQKIPLDPQCGYYERRYLKGGPWMPARIWADPVGDPIQASLGKMTMRCEVGGLVADAAQEWDAVCLHPISKGRYAEMMAKIDGAHPRERFKPIDILSAPAPHCPPKAKGRKT